MDNKEREFKVNEAVIKSKYPKCMVCLKKFKMGEQIVLCPIQKPRSGWASVISIPIHLNCYWVKNE